MNYYNDNDPKSVAWLRELIKQNIIPPGDVDERSITDVTGSDLKGYTQVHMFAGIGGWSEALRLAGWPATKPVWTGSCPCQPFSCAGQRKGEKDKRHLWPEFRRLIAECHPPIVFGEQVASKDGRKWLSGVRTDLENLGYAVGAADLCAAGAGAPHIRQRLYWGGVADAGFEQSYRRTKPCETQSSRAFSDIGGCGNFSRVADTEYNGHDRPGQYEAKQGRNGKDDGIFVGSGSKLCGASSGMANSESVRRGIFDTKNIRQADGEINPLTDASDLQLCGMEYPAGDGRDTRRAESDGRGAPGGCGENFWSNGIWLPCADGKARRIEPESFPLVNGVPGRVGLLRGYGNAIVPEVAAEFVKAFMEM